MGVKDLHEKNLFERNDVFASLINALFLLKIKPDDLDEWSPELVVTVEEDLEHRFRDVYKRLLNHLGVGIAFLGLENQTNPAKDMPIRVMTYDALSYAKQVEAVKNKQAEKVLPIVTIVLYFGYDKPWNAPLTLHECFEIPAMLEPVVANYPVRVVELAWLDDDQLEQLQGDLKLIAECLRHFRDPQKWPFPEGKIKYVEDVFALLGAITGDAIFERLLEEHRNMEDLDMKNSFERVRNFYRSEGFDLGERRGEERGEMRGIKLGEERGERRGKQERSVEIACNLLSMRMPKHEVAKATGLSIEEIEQLALSYA